MITVCEDREALAHAAAELFTEQARQAVTNCGRFLVLLAGGETPRRTYQILAHEPFRSLIPWSEIHFFWGDERCVAPDDPRSNFYMAQHSLLEHLQLPEQHVHAIRCNRTPQRSADTYQADLIEFFSGEAPRFDLVFLGLGADGHTASLLPGSAALQEQVRWTAVTRRSEDDFSRITLTAPIINQAKLVLFLVAGSDKAMVMAHVLNGTTEGKQYPAQLIRPQSGELRWFADREAARYLTR